MIHIIEKHRKLSLSNYRGKYLQCPNCGKMRLKPYAYDGGIIENERLGRCQREVNCGYHLKPAEYFHDKGESFQNTCTYSEPVRKDMFTLDKGFCARYYENYFESTLFNFFQCTGVDFTDVFKTYFVGATRSGATVFFQNDGVIFRAGKVIKYLENGHRDKSVRPPVLWLHKKVDGFDEEKYEIRQCFFGRHLLDNSEVVCLVESEKTAILCAGLFPDAVWMATGGRTQLSGVGLSELSQKKVISFPDADSVRYWSDKLRTYGSFEVCDLSEFNVAKKDGADIADYILECSEAVRASVYMKINDLVKSKLL